MKNQQQINELKKNWKSLATKAQEKVEKERAEFGILLDKGMDAYNAVINNGGNFSEAQEAYNAVFQANK